MVDIELAAMSRTNRGKSGTRVGANRCGDVGTSKPLWYSDMCKGKSARQFCIFHVNVLIGSIANWQAE
jgi:hypothetical protein